MRPLTNFVFVLALLLAWTNYFATKAFCHRGGLDSKGGHNGPGGYHSHSGGKYDSRKDSGSDSFWGNSGLGNPSQGDLNDQMKRQRQFGGFSERDESLPQARTTARTTARTHYRKQAYKKYVISRFLEFELIRSSAIQNLYTARIRITTPKTQISRADIYAIPGALSNGKDSSIEILLEDQEDDATPWGDLTYDQSDGFTFSIASGLSLEEDLRLEPGTQATRGVASYRPWSDSNLKYKTNAKLSDHCLGKVGLIREDGTYITVPSEKLSEADSNYLEAIRPEHSNRDACVRLGTARVLSVDTLEFTDLRGKSEHLRIFGLVPKMNEEVEGKNFLVKLIAKHPLVRVETLSETGKDANIFSGNIWLNRELVLRGYAIVNPAVEVAKEIQEAQEIARQKEEDIWGER